MPGGHVHRSGVGRTVQDMKRRRKRPCASAPKVPTGLTQTFIKKDVHHQEVWRARVTFTAVTLDVADRPLAPERYDVELRYTDASGVPITLSGAADDVRRESIQADQTPLKVVFEDLAHPRSWYVQTRIRTMNRVRGGRCFSAWSAWTTATNPSTGALPGPAAPSSLTLTFDKVEGFRKYPWRARAKWNEIGTWTPTDGDPLDGVMDYIIWLQVSNDGGVTVANTRKVKTPAEFGAGTAKRDFFGIRAKRHYRARVRARDIYGRLGAFTSYTSWVSPGVAPGAARNLVISKPVPGRLIGRWDPPVDLTDADRARVRIIKGASTVMDEFYTYGNKASYDIPAADRASAHKMRVNYVEDEVALDIDDTPTAGFAAPQESADGDTASDTNNTKWGVADVDAAVLAGTDGLVPTSHPAATVQGGPGWILAKWTAISNADPVWYDVYISATDLGSTVAAWTATTKVGTVDGTFHFITKLGTGAALAYGTTYFVALIARDQDGTATAALPARGSAAMVKIPTVDVATGAITANEIAANTITAGEIAANAINASEINANAVTAAKLESTLVLSTLIKAVGAGGRVEIDSAGIRLYNATSGGTNTVNLVSADGSATFTGEILTNGNPVLRPGGFPRCKLTYAGGNNLANDTDFFVRFGTEVDDTDAFHAATTDNCSTTGDSSYDLLMPFDGQYLVIMGTTWTANGTGRRDMFFRNDTLGTTLERQTNQTVSVAAGMQSTATWVLTLNDANAFRVGVRQTSGSSLVLISARLSVIYLGDAA